ncbi:MAG TPA: hypothetical protein VFG42_05100 [Baekduia sp.]|uniref:hypothetical protein n=1 Tax=Baekduia sp. TaxID=2600305 RepID=UPI002D77E40F|nr:hypothetical protein [Baekduia sp.]HET6506143.1 hypothetical protein [Baekduia sp.]
MLRTRIAGAAGALALLATPAVAAAHGNGHHHHKRHHHHVVKRDRDVTGTASATIQSFAGGELTLALPSGKTYTADVTDRTVIICWTAPSSTTAKAANHGRGDGNDDPGDQGRGSTTTPPSTVSGDDHGRCGTDKLATGAKVAVAKLSLIGDAVTWKKVVVVS